AAGLGRAHTGLAGAAALRASAQQIVFQNYVMAVEDAERRRDALTEQIGALTPSWSMAPVVAALQALRGMALVSAATLLAEIGDLRRFANPQQLMSHLGLVRSEQSSGVCVRRGGITKTGNVSARRIMVEAAWSYRLPARVGRTILEGLQSLPKAVRDIAWKAQVRLCARYRRLAGAGKKLPLVTTAIAQIAWLLLICRKHA
ncbi:MAG: IS110 family transposase, partial [Acetobacteraceae bacterium]|nr:IS110 family transposase [Acetobacteraceae bacterium]